MLKEDIRERKEERREMRISLDKIVINFQHKMNQRIQSKIDEVKIISERSHGQIQKSTETMWCTKSESNQAQITRQSSSLNSEGDVEMSATVAIQEHATIDQGVIVVSSKGATMVNHFGGGGRGGLKASFLREREIESKQLWVAIVSVFFEQTVH
jgi:hypothetical protein